ncbi:hypothetical protein QQS21_005610 [Conoideocrella luteorostrata]|uniref:FAD-binding FR-type domain-containing protein n=1 Tax=Conoideocrella luteorostrata TaxID=1105319 RepID=A0AAJ0CP58_9HYPO|nr:hypothetical protein QQS21_005610 [Conoideocrella luteorostrata]
MLGHVSIFNGQYDGLFWVPVFIWLFDRVLRACRIVAFNPFSWGTDSFAVYHNTSNVVQLSIPVESNSAYLARPGTYYYIMVLDDTCCWESHPFTVASVPVSPQSPDETYSEMSPLLHDPHDMANSEPGSRRAPAMKLRNNCMTFLIRPYNDFTRRLKELAISSGRMRVLVDGPYGHAHPLHHYDRVVFVVGGSGIVTPMSYLPLLGRTHSHSTPKMVEIHWAVREVSFAETVVWEYLHRALSTNALSLNLYVSSSSTDDATSERGFPPWVRQHQKRPHVAQIVDSAAMESDYGRLAIVACGPEALVDDARLAVVDILERSTCHIDYFQENFFW